MDNEYPMHRCEAREWVDGAYYSAPRGIVEQSLRTTKDVVVDLLLFTGCHAILTSSRLVGGLRRGVQTIRNAYLSWSKYPA